MVESGELFSWHEGKRREVLAVRGIDFADLALCFADPHALTRVDGRRDYGEIRFNMLASYAGVILNITYTPRHGRYHLISARL
eukprot:gene28763-32149_t